MNALHSPERPKLQKVLADWNAQPNEVKTWPQSTEIPDAARYDVEHWLSHIQHGCERRRIPREQWIEAAIFFLRGDLKDLFLPVIENPETRHNIEGWDDFGAFMVNFDEPTQEDPEEFNQPPTSNTENSNGTKIARLAGGGLLAGGSVMTLPSAGIAALHVIGFTPSGIAAGTLAAGIQATLYGGKTTGLLSICQAIGRTATIAPPAVIGIGLGAMVAGAGCVAWSTLNARRDSTVYQ